MTIRLAERELKTRFGTFTEILYYNGQCESIALVMGAVQGADGVLCRIHSACIGGHVFNSIECECHAEMAAAQLMIQEAGGGVIIYLDQEGKGNGHLALMQSAPYKLSGSSQAEAYEKAGYARDARSYRGAAAIISDLQIQSIHLLSENSSKADELREMGVNVARTSHLNIKSNK